MNLKLLSLIALGGAAGSIARFALMSSIGHLWPMNFPLSTLIVNLLGSFLMGCAITIFAHLSSVPQHVQALITVGILGGFTTFSTFSLDSVVLYERGALLSLATYVILSVVGGFVGLFAGIMGLRWILP